MNIVYCNIICQCMGGIQLCNIILVNIHYATMLPVTQYLTITC